MTAWRSILGCTMGLLAACSEAESGKPDHEQAPDAPSMSTEGGSSDALQPPAADDSSAGESSAGAAAEPAGPATTPGSGGAAMTPASGAGGEQTSPPASGGTAAAIGGMASGGMASGGVPSAGSAGSGEAGASDQPVTAAAEACLSCGTASCGPVLQACEQNPECAPWLGCLSRCESSACSSACDARYADVSRVYYGVYACLCGSCAADCEFSSSCEKRCVDAAALPAQSSAPAALSDTGLYQAGDTVSDRAYAYSVRFPLWADGADKGRYVYVPRCATIDTTDMDHWGFPVGTRLWKEFAVDGKLIETRFLHRFGTGADDWLYATYGWDTSRPNDPSAARLVKNGASNAGGTLHDIPDLASCASCHGKLPEKLLGFGAFQLSHSSPGLNMQKLSDWGWLSVPARRGFSVPGTPVQQAALGYLHGNCGGCHNGQSAIPREDPMRLRLLVAQTEYGTTDAVTTTIGVPTINAYPELHGKPRISPQAPDDSAVFLRMSDRNKFPMPPLATKFSDADGGVAAVRAWIESLPASRVVAK